MSKVNPKQEKPSQNEPSPISVEGEGKKYTAITVATTSLLIVGIVMAIGFFTFGTRTSIYMYIALPSIIFSLVTFLIINYRIQVNKSGTGTLNKKGKIGFGVAIGVIVLITAGLIYAMFSLTKFCPAGQKYDSKINKCVNPIKPGVSGYSCVDGVCEEDSDNPHFDNKEDCVTSGCKAAPAIPPAEWYCKDNLCYEDTKPASICVKGSKTKCFKTDKECNSFVTDPKSGGCCSVGSKNFFPKGCDSNICCRSGCWKTDNSAPIPTSTTKADCQTAGGTWITPQACGTGSGEHACTCIENPITKDDCPNPTINYKGDVTDAPNTPGSIFEDICGGGCNTRDDQNACKMSRANTNVVNGKPQPWDSSQGAEPSDYGIPCDTNQIDYCKTAKPNDSKCAWDAYSETNYNKCICYKDCSKLPTCQSYYIDPTTKNKICSIPPHYLVDISNLHNDGKTSWSVGSKYGNPILSQVSESGGMTCSSQINALTEELACNNCKVGKGIVDSNGKQVTSASASTAVANDHCSSKPSLRWDSTALMCCDDAAVSAITIVFPGGTFSKPVSQPAKSPLLDTSQVTGTLYFKSPANISYPESKFPVISYIYRLWTTPDKKGNYTLYTGPVLISGIGDDNTCSTNTPCLKFIAFFDEGVTKGTYNFSISGISRDSSGTQFAKYLSIGVNNNPYTVTLPSVTYPAGVSPAFIPLISKGVALQAANEGHITPFGHVKTGSKAPLPNDGPGGVQTVDNYLVSPAIDPLSTTSGQLMVILGWCPPGNYFDSSSKSCKAITSSDQGAPGAPTAADVATAVSNCKLQPGSKVYLYYVIWRADSTNPLSLSFTPITISPITNNYYADTTAYAGKNYVYRIASFYSTALTPSFNNSTCKSPFVYINVETPIYTDKMCRGISAIYSKNSGTDIKTMFPPYLIAGGDAKGGSCIWPMPSNDTKYADTYCMLENPDRDSNTPATNGGGFDSCLTSGNCKPGDFNPNSISLYVGEGTQGSTGACETLLPTQPTITYSDGEGGKDWKNTYDASTDWLDIKNNKQAKAGLSGVCHTGKNQSRTLSCPTTVPIGDDTQTKSQLEGRITGVGAIIKNRGNKDDQVYITNGTPQSYDVGANSVISSYDKDGNPVLNTDFITSSGADNLIKNFTCCPFVDSNKSVLSCDGTAAGVTCSGNSNDPSLCSTWATSTVGNDKVGNTTGISGDAIQKASCYYAGGDITIWDQDKQTGSIVTDCPDCQYSFNACNSWKEDGNSSNGDPTWTQNRNYWPLVFNHASSEETGTSGMPPKYVAENCCYQQQTDGTILCIDNRGIYSRSSPDDDQSTETCAANRSKSDDWKPGVAPAATHSPTDSKTITGPNFLGCQST